mgnify:CR=1 FL=1
MINKNKPLEEPKKPKGSRFKSFWKSTKGIRHFIKLVLIVIGVIALIVGAFIHIVLLMLLGATEYKDSLDYCEYTYGNGWILEYDSPLGDYCYFIEENGDKRINYITEQQRDSRLCEIRFYNPFYCG